MTKGPITTSNLDYCKTLSAQQMLFLVICQGLNLVGLIGELAWWLVIFMAFTFMLRLLAIYQYQQLNRSLQHSQSEVNQVNNKAGEDQSNQLLKKSTSSIVLDKFIKLVSPVLRVLASNKFLANLLGNNEVSAQQSPHYQISKWLLYLLIFSGLSLLGLAAKSLGLLLSMVHLLVFAYLLKVFEIKSQTNVLQLSMLGLFVLATNLLFSQTLYFSVFIFVLLIANFALLANIFLSGLQVGEYVKQARKLVLHSMPLAFILFVFFPKIEPFWTMPTIKSSNTGLSDQLSVGDVGRLVRSNELAFRATFEGKAPPTEQLYWRAIVLEQFNGKTWRRAEPLRYGDSVIKEAKFDASVLALQNKLNHYRYKVIMSPSNEHWLFSLDSPLANNGHNQAKNHQIHHLTDASLYAERPVNKTIEYQVDSYQQGGSQQLHLFPEVSSFYQPIFDNYHQDVLKMPINPRLKAYSEYLKAQVLASKPESQQAFTQAFINQVLDRFHYQNYNYTLEPPLLTGHTLDQFFFDTQAGFCGHYASSLTFILRASGIPARIVTGYLGGEYNPDGNYYSVYQRDAHAWVEVWITDKSKLHQGYWQRVDPTAAVHPDRVQNGLTGELLEQQARLSDNFLNLSQYRQLPWLNELRLKMAAVDYHWTKWFLNYSFSNQQQLLSRWFGSAVVSKVALVLLLAFLLTIAWLAYAQRPVKEKAQVNKASEYYLQALAWLATCGVNKKPCESASQFAEQLVSDSSLSNELRASFNQLSQLYISLNYQGSKASDKHSQAEQHQKALKNMATELKALKKYSKQQAWRTYAPNRLLLQLKRKL